MPKPKSYVKKPRSKKENKSTNKKREEWAVKIVRIFGTPLAKGIAHLPVKVHPNVVTVFSLLFAIIAAFFFFNNQLIYGAIFFFISYVFDTADGTLARLTNTQSELGKRLDFYVDILGNIFMYFGLWYSQFYLYGQWFIGGSIIAAHYMVIAFGYMFIKNRTYKTIFPDICSYYSAADEGFLTFFFVPIPAFFILGIFRLALPILVALQFISFVILFLRQKEKPDIKKNIKEILKL
jgi:phosphatidylglycerophosphate synthase